MKSIKISKLLIVLTSLIFSNCQIHESKFDEKKIDTTDLLKLKIDSLINKIDLNNRVNFEPVDITSSFWDTCLTNNFEGIRIALQIEKILAKDSIKTNFNSKQKWLYNRGLIFRYGKGKSKLTLNDMKIIKHYYQIWSLRLGKMPLDSIFLRWNQNDRPLTKSEYYWE